MNWKGDVIQDTGKSPENNQAEWSEYNLEEGERIVGIEGKTYGPHSIRKWGFSLVKI